MSILIACEESQSVTKEFRKLGFNAFSCDLSPCSGGHPEWHLQKNVLPLLFKQWDLIIAFPPCTNLCVSGAAWFEEKLKDGRVQRAVKFFMAFTRCKCARVAIENPVGLMSTVWRKPNQIIQPWWFGDSFSKKTCLWLKGLPPLLPTSFVDEDEWMVHKSGKRTAKWYGMLSPSENRSKIRSKTFPGIAKAMADQWGKLLK